MHPLHEQLQNPLTRERDSRDRARIAKAFPVLNIGTSKHFLALRRYLNCCPEKFFDGNAFEIYLRWLLRRKETEDAALKDYFLRFENEINKALLFLREINSESWHDKSLKTGDEFDLVRIIDKHVHPTYLRLVEAVLTPLARPLAFFSRLDRGKGTEGLDVWPVIKELERDSTKYLIKSYRHIIRNAIAHGGITFRQDEIRYQDKKGNEERFRSRAIISLFDDFLDICNGIAAGLKVFFLISRHQGYNQPQELLIEELQEETWAPWWAIEGCVESEYEDNSQLIIYARPNSRHFSKVQWSAIRSGILAEYFAPGYNRYFFSLRSPKAWPGYVAFDGKKLRSLREARAKKISQYVGIIENNLVFYVPRPAIPAWLGKLDTLLKTLLLTIPIAIQNIKEQIGRPSIVCRNASIHRNAWGSVVRAEVVIEDLNDETAASVVRKNRVRILKKAIKKARRENRLSGASYLPLGFALVAVFRRDYRCRRLSGFGLGKDLVCTIQHQRISRIKSPDILGSTVEVKGRWRIAWNKAWLEGGENLLD